MARCAGSPALRRAALKMAPRWRERALGLQTVVTQMSALVENFAQASTRLAVVDPNRFVPDGILGSRSYDNVPLPADLNALVDLQPYTGLVQSMTGNEIKAIQVANAAARALAATTKKKAPLMGDVWHRGLLTETHAIRVAQLQSIAAVPLPGDIGSLIQSSSTRGNEGVLVSVQKDGVTSQGVRIDGRSGVLKVVGRALTITRTGKVAGVANAPRAPTTAVAGVPLGALKLYGNTAVFSTLPPSTLGRSAGAVKIGLAGPGNL